MVMTVEDLSLAEHEIDWITESAEDALGPHAARDLFLEVLIVRMHEFMGQPTVEQYRSDPWLKALSALATLAREARLDLNRGPSTVENARRGFLEEFWTLMKEVEGS